jgi:uncharacterized protein (TIGR02145 family)
MNPMSVFRIKLFTLVCVALIAGTFSACGEDSTPFRDVENEISTAESSSSEKISGKKVSSSSLESNVDIKEGPVSRTDSIDVSEYDDNEIIKDKQSEKVYELLVSGINVWMAENLDYKPNHPISTCYDYADSLCRDYGRLYSSKQRDDITCPEGYQLPKASDWRLLLESKDDYKPQFAGKCNQISGKPLECIAIKDTSYYLTQDDSIVVLPKKGTWKVVKNSSKIFTSVRCIKHLSIIEKKKDLPKCNNDYSQRTVYVIENDSAYKCQSSEWKYAKTYSVCKDGEKYLYKGKSDSLYSCKNGMWHIADLSDINRPCLDENRHKDVTLSGYRYACTDTGWAKLPYPASVLGECYLEHFGVIAKADSVNTFVCRNTGLWTSAGPVDVFGKCNKDRDGSIVTLDTMEYFCTMKYDGRWNRRDDDAVTKEHGFCTDERYNEKQVTHDQYYLCGSDNRWIRKDNFDYFDKCDTTLWDSVGFVGSLEYLCNRYLKKWQTVPHMSFEEFENEIGCTPKVYGKIYSRKYSGEKYICKVNSNLLYQFLIPSETELKYGICGRDTAFSISESDSVTYVCQSGSWSKRVLNKYEIKFGICPRDTTYFIVEDTLVYTCRNGSWSSRKLSALEYKLGICPRDTTYEVLENMYVYTCKNGTWSEQKLSECESKFGKCTKDSNYVKLKDKTGCFCESGAWKQRVLESVEINYEICRQGVNYIIFDNRYTYTCKNGDITKYTTTKSDRNDVFGKCQSSTHGIDTVYYGQRFVCDIVASDEWIQYGILDTLAGSHCTETINNKEVKLNDTTYFTCTHTVFGYEWKQQYMSERMSVCVKDKEGAIETNGLTRSVCRNSKWVPADTFHVTDSRDGNEYAVITIAGKTWMAEPLAYVPEGQQIFVIGKKYPVESVNRGQVVFYPWAVAMGLDRKYDSTYAGDLFKDKAMVQGICMDGWHLPNLDEISELDKVIKKNFRNYVKLFEDKDIVGIHFIKTNSRQIYQNSETGIDSLGIVSNSEVEHVWTSQEQGYSKAYEACFTEDYQISAAVSKLQVFPVRCVKDD